MSNEACTYCGDPRVWKKEDRSNILFSSIPEDQAPSHVSSLCSVRPSKIEHEQIPETDQYGDHSLCDSCWKMDRRMRCTMNDLAWEKEKRDRNL